MFNEKTVGRQIAELRQKKNLSRADFADVMAVSVQAIGKWERGESLPDILTIKRMSDYFGVSVDYFFNDSAINNAADDCGQFETKKQGHKIPVRNMSVSNWKDADFSGLDNLAGKFSASNVINSKFCDSDLNGIIFKSNNIKNCDFSNANLSGGKFSMCNMPNNKFFNSSFKNTIIKMCDIHASNFQSVDFTNAEFNGTVLKQNDFDKAKFMGTTFKNLRIEKLLISTDIQDCVFMNSTIRGVIFENMTFKNTFFKNIKAKNSKFINCKADKITISFMKNCKINTDGLRVNNE